MRTGSLNHQVMRVFTVGGVPCCDQDNSGNKVALSVSYAARRPGLSFDMFFFNGSTRGQQGREFSLGCLTPTTLLRKCEFAFQIYHQGSRQLTSMQPVY